MKNNLIASGLLWAGFVCWFSFLLNNEDPNSLRWKRIGCTHQGCVPGNRRAYSDHFPPEFSLGFHVKKLVTQGYNLLGEFSSSSWNVLHCWFVELVIFVCRIVGYNHLWNLIWTSVPYHCFSSPERVCNFSRSYFDHSELVHISEEVFCVKTTMPIPDCEIFLPVLVCPVE